MVVIQFEFTVGGRERPRVFNDLPDLALRTFLYSGRDPDQQKHCTRKASAKPNLREILDPFLLVTALLVEVITSLAAHPAAEMPPLRRPIAAISQLVQNRDSGAIFPARAKQGFQIGAESNFPTKSKVSVLGKLLGHGATRIPSRRQTLNQRPFSAVLVLCASSFVLCTALLLLHSLRELARNTETAFCKEIVFWAVWDVVDF